MPPASAHRRRICYLSITAAAAAAAADNHQYRPYKRVANSTEREREAASRTVLQPNNGKSPLRMLRTHVRAAVVHLNHHRVDVRLVSTLRRSPHPAVSCYVHARRHHSTSSDVAAAAAAAEWNRVLLRGAAERLIELMSFIRKRVKDGASSS